MKQITHDLDTPEGLAAHHKEMGKLVAKVFADKGCTEEGFARFSGRFRKALKESGDRPYNKHENKK